MQGSDVSEGCDVGKGGEVSGGKGNHLVLHPVVMIIVVQTSRGNVSLEPRRTPPPPPPPPHPPGPPHLKFLGEVIGD